MHSLANRFVIPNGMKNLIRENQTFLACMTVEIPRRALLAMAV